VSRSSPASPGQAADTVAPNRGAMEWLSAPGYHQVVRLFTPVSPEEARLLESGVALNGPLYWVDRQVPEEADEDAVWVVAVIPDKEIAPFEQADPQQGYREFILPPPIPTKYPVKRVGDQ
jgi:hypothetical protein